MKTQSTTIQMAPTAGFFSFVRPFALTLLLAAGLPVTTALGSPAGELDPSFGDHGRILLRETVFQDMSGVKVFADPASGKLLTVATGWPYSMLLRFNSDGSRDSGYGYQGAVTLDLGDNNLNILDVEWLTGGNLLVTGVMNAYSDPNNVSHGTALLARLHSDGTPDDSFGNHGQVILQRGGFYESFSEILVQADDRIVIFGSTDRSGRVERILARYTQDGLADTSFGDAATPGMSTVSVAGDREDLLAMVQQGDGTFMACGNTASSNGSPPFREALVVRILANGLRDSTYGTNGKVLLAGQQNGLEVRDCLALPDAHLAIAGTFGRGEEQRAAIFRLTPDGRLDAGFGDNGMVVLPTARSSTAQTMLLMTDGSLAIAGTHTGPTETRWYPWIDMLIARIDPTSGDIDHQFGNGGVTAVDFGMRDYAGRAAPASIMQQPDGKLVAVGAQTDPGDWWDTPYIAITRVDPYGSGSNGWAGLNQNFVSAPADGGAVVVQVRRTGGSTGALSVDYRTVDDTATAGSDYVATSGTLSWPDGDMSDRLIGTTVSTAELATNNEFFKFELFNSSGGLAVDQATIEISRTAPPVAPPPPPGGGNNQGNANVRGGGGAITLELWFLMGFAILGFMYRRAPRYRGNVGHDPNC